MKFKRKQQDEQMAIYKNRLAKGKQKKPLPKVAPPPPPKPKPWYPAIGSLWLVKSRYDGPKYKVVEVGEGNRTVTLEWWSKMQGGIASATVNLSDFDKTTGFLVEYEMENV